MADKTIKHFVIVRFYPFQDPKFTRDIFDVDFISMQVLLAKNNLLKSLANQMNKNFEIVFFANDGYFSDRKYDFIFTELRHATTLPIKFVKGSDLAPLIQSAYNDYDFVIQSRIDFDDFVHKNGVEDVQNKINECENILAYGYCRGYTYFNGEVRPYYDTYNGNGHLAMLQSFILSSSFAKKIPFILVYHLLHTEIKQRLERFLVSKGFQFSENMFQQNTSTNAFIYFRHDTTYSHKGQPIEVIPGYIRSQRKLTSTDITKEQLKAEFGFDGYELNSIK